MEKLHFNSRSLSALINTVIISTTLMAGTAFASNYNAASVNLSLDNDVFLGTDKGYTNGVFLKFNSSTTTDITENSAFPLKTVGSWLPLNTHSNKGWGIKVGQQIWTPTDISSPVEGAHDRPYTGFLFAEASIFEYTSSFANKYTLMLGGVGPDTLAKNSQKIVHRIIDSPKPLGWARQIQNQSVVNLTYEGQQLLTRAKSWQDKEYDTSLSGRINAGNYQSEIALGSTIRWGHSLNESFASVGSSPGKFIDSSALSTSREGQFLYVSLEGRYRFQDITIDGARPSHRFDVHTEHWQATLSSGAVYYQKSWGLAFSIISSTAEYEEDLRDYNSTTSIEVFWRI